jgi:hypothetical protein
MDKRRLHHIWTKIRPIKAWYLAVLFVISASITVLALRQNNLTMVALRQEVYAADQQNGDVEGALQRLRTHVHSHMNTNLATGQESVYPPIQLKYTYQRLQEAERARVQQGSGAVYTEAQAHCERLNPSDFSGRSRIPCIEQYVSTHTVKEKTIPAAMYKFDFVSPAWSPDLAGFSLIITITLLLLLILRILAGRIFKHLLK